MPLPPASLKFPVSQYSPCDKWDINLKAKEQVYSGYSARGESFHHVLPVGLNQIQQDVLLYVSIWLISVQTPLDELFVDSYEEQNQTGI